MNQGCVAHDVLGLELSFRFRASVLRCDYRRTAHRRSLNSAATGRGNADTGFRFGVEGYYWALAFRGMRLWGLRGAAQRVEEQNSAAFLSVQRNWKYGTVQPCRGNPKPRLNSSSIQERNRCRFGRTSAMLVSHASAKKKLSIPRTVVLG